MKKILSMIALSAVLSAGVFGQVSVDPSNSFYDFAFNWYNRGVVSQLPPTRPYPLANVKAILDEVLQNGNDRDKENASDFYEKFTGKKIHLYLDADGYVKMEHTKTSDSGDNELGKNICVYPGVEGDVSFSESDFVSVGYKMGVSVAKNPDTQYMPMFNTTMHDGVFDPTTIGPMKLYLTVNDIINVGRKDIFFQGGIYRSGYGNYLGEGLILNDKRFHSTNLSFTYMGEKLFYTQLFAMLGSTSTYDGNTDSLKGDKYLGFHAVGYKVCDWFDFSFYESTVVGKRLELAAVLPVPFMIAEELTGALDGVFMGLTLNFKPTKGLTIAADVMVDDFPLDDFFKFDFDSKYRLAARAGIIWTPKDSTWLDRINANYTIVTPYTYSHWDYSDYNSKAVILPGANNYQNYTNNGIKIGSMYEPNTDALEFTMDTHPIRELKVSIKGLVARHGNVCESLTDSEALTYLSSLPGTYSTDGSVYTHAMFANPLSDLGTHVETAWTKLNFMSQEHIQTTVQFGVNAEYDFNIKQIKSRLTLKAGVTLEYIHNYGVGNHLYSGLGKNATASDLYAARKAWEDNLCNKFNLYGNIGFAYRF